MLLFYRVFFNSVRTYCFFTNIPFPSDKMSNESLHREHARTKMRLGGFRGPSRAIRKIHIDSKWLFRVAWGRRKWGNCILWLFITLFYPSFYYLPICWRRPSSRERNSLLFTSTFQRFDFRGRNNSVWGMKLMCLTRQTILFGSRNNIVPGTFCSYSGNEMYSFLKSKAFLGGFVCIR